MARGWGTAIVGTGTVSIDHVHVMHMADASPVECRARLAIERFSISYRVGDRGYPP